MTNTTKKWIAIAIIAAVIVGALALIKVFPFWVTLCCLVSLIAGIVAGYMYKKPEIITEIKEVIKEVPAPKKTKSKQK